MTFTKQFPVYLLFLLFILLISCSGEQVIYEKYHKFDNLSWNRFDYLNFEVEFEDVESEYDVYLVVRHIPEIPYKKMLVNLVIYSPAGGMRTANHDLWFVDEQGKSLSDCMGDLCDIEFLIRKAYSVSEPGIVKFEVENKYTKVEMPGIIEVGLIVREAEK